MNMPSVFDFSELLRRIRQVLFRRDDPALRELLQKTGDDEVVHVIDDLPIAEKRRAFRTMLPERQGRLITKLSDYSQETLLPLLNKEELRAMIDAVESDDAVDVIQLMDDAQREKVIDELKRNDPHELLPLLVFGEETAGGLMKSEVIRVKNGLSVDEARRGLAKDPTVQKHRSHHIYVVDDAGALVGMLPLMRLLSAAAEAKIADVMGPPPTSIPPFMDQEEVAKVFDEHDAIELPVVGAKGRLLGCITADDIFEVMEQEYLEDVAGLTGVSEDDHVSDPVLLKVRRRLPWLIVNLATAVLAASVVGLFQDTIQRLVLLAAFMPIIAGMGGNAATQTLSVMVRALALGELHHVNTARSVGKEIAAGVLNGLASGIIMGAIAYVWTLDVMLSVVILVAMTANLLVAGLGGASIPLIMKRMRIDPALASTVFVTTLTDCCGFFVFLGLASLLL